MTELVLSYKLVCSIIISYKLESLFVNVVSFKIENSVTLTQLLFGINFQ